MKNRQLKILTDIQIKQSPLWGEKTDYAGVVRIDNRSQSGFPQKIFSHLVSFINLTRLCKQLSKYDVVITARLGNAETFGLFRKLFRIRRPKHIILELMLDEEDQNLKWKIKELIRRFIYPWVDLIFVSSRSEVETYSRRLNIPKDRIKFLPFHTNIIEPRLVNKNNNYILSVGQTGRDWAVLAEAVRGLNEQVIVISDKDSIEGIVFPPNTKILTDVPYSEYLELLSNCRLLVVPLKKLVKSTGQVVILEGMALGKPVIATRTTGTVDYIDSGINGILVAPEDPVAIRNAIDSVIHTPALEWKLSINAWETVNRNHTFDIYVRRILKAAEEHVTSGEETSG